MPADLGGAGASYLEAATVAEALGGFLAPVPFVGTVATTAALTSVVSDAIPAAGAAAHVSPGAAALSFGRPGGISPGAARVGGATADAATGEPAARLLRDLAEGAATMAFAVGFTHRPGASYPSSARLAGLKAGDADAGVSRLSGTVTGMADALTADVLLVPAQGVPHGIYAVQTPGPGVSVTPVISLDMTRQLCDVTLDSAPGMPIASGAAAVRAVEAALRAGAAMLAAEQLGIAERCLTMTVAYLKERRQFARPVGSFQALKHRLADQWVSITQARAAARYAAACLASGAPDEAAIAVAVAKAYCSEIALHAAQECVQLHGGIGFTWEHPAHLYLKRAKADLVGFGSPDAHRSELASLVNIPAP